MKPVESGPGKKDNFLTRKRFRNPEDEASVEEIKVENIESVEHEAVPASQAVKSIADKPAEKKSTWADIAEKGEAAKKPEAKPENETKPAVTKKEEKTESEADEENYIEIDGKKF